MHSLKSSSSKWTISLLGAVSAIPLILLFHWWQTHALFWALCWPFLPDEKPGVSSIMFLSSSLQLSFEVWSGEHVSAELIGSLTYSISFCFGNSFRKGKLCHIIIFMSGLVEERPLLAKLVELLWSYPPWHFCLVALVLDISFLSVQLLSEFAAGPHESPGEM